MQLAQNRRATIISILLIMVTVVVWYYALKPLFSNIIITACGQCVPGYIVDADEDYGGESDAGQPMWSTYITYSYQLQNGRNVVSTCNLQGRLKPWLLSISKNNINSSHTSPGKTYMVDVYYLPGNPEVSFIKGAGGIRTAVGDAFLFMLFGILPGLYGFSTLKDIARKRKEAQQS